MKIFLAGHTSFLGKPLTKELVSGVYVLESFFYANQKTEQYIPYFKDFLLDSGAFTFFSSGKKDINWDEYVERYAKFIVKNNINHFFELDIDKLVGYEKVLDLREKLETMTGRKCIPVWHKGRGKDEFLKMCDEYKYVAVGGIVSKEITKEQYDLFKWLITEAHKRGCKIHGLGFTNLEGVTKYNFDTVDSTSWTTGNRFGAIYKFNGRTMEKFGKKKGQRIGDYYKALVNNYIEWVKFQQYADIML